MSKPKLPIFKQFFEKFRGIDLTSSPLGRGLDRSREFKNLERLHNGTLRSREGLELASQHLQVISIFPYIYVDENEITREKLIGVAAFSNLSFKKHLTLVSLETGALSITYSGSGFFSFTVTKSTSGVVFTLNEDGSPVLTSNLGSGYQSADITLQALANSITALTDFSASVEKTAIVNGAQSNVTTITVDSGHSLNIGDYIYFNDAQSGNPEERVAQIINTSATTITIPSDSTYGDVNVLDNAVLGIGNFKAAILNCTSFNTSFSAGTQDVSFTYWGIIPTQLDGDFLGFLTSESLVPRSVFENGLPDFTNHRNNLFITANFFPEVEAKTNIKTLGNIDYNAGVWKYDNHSFYLSGLFFTLGDSAFSLTNTGSGSVALGNYKYGMSFKRTDAQGNEIEFFHSLILPFAITPTNNPDFKVLDTFATVYQKQLNFKHAKLTSGTTASNTLTITSGHLFRVGDYVYLTDTTDGTIKRKVTAITLTTIVIDGAVVTVANNDRVSNFLLRIWRTKGDGNTLYLAKEYPFFSSISETYSDNITDANLGILQSAVKPVNIQYPFARGKCLETHQGVLVSASANTVYWEDADSPESSPRAVSNANIPYGTTEDIRSLISNIDSSLYVIKPNAQYELLGNMANNEIEINKVSENSIGSNGNKSILVLDNSLIGMGEIGAWASQNGNRALGFGSQILDVFNRAIIDVGTEYKLNLNKCILSYDRIKNWVHFYLPFEYCSSFSLVNRYYSPSELYTKHYVLMISSIEDQPDCISEFVYDIRQQGNAGFACIGNDFYQQSNIPNNGNSGSYLTGYLHKRSSKVSEEDYLDHTLTYESILTTEWDDGGEPSIFKFFLDLVVFQLQPNDFINSFNINFESYRDWDETKVDTIRSSALSFSSNNTQEKTLQFDKNFKAKRRSFKFSSTVNKNPMLLSGYEYTVNETAYNKQRIIK
jgi:hypothetical protein